MSRRPRLSELLLRVVVRDEESYLGLLGDLHEEAARRGERSGGPAYNRAVLALARSYLTERLPGRGASHIVAGSDDRHGWLRSALADSRAAARLLRRRPGYTIAVVGTLGLGFGAAAAVLSVAYGVWLKPLPFGEPNAIVRVYEVKLEGDEGNVAGEAPIRPSALDANVARRQRVSPPLLHDMRGRDWATLTQLASVSGIALDWRHDGEASRLSGVSASRGVFDVLRLQPLVGRFFAAEAGVREVVVSEGLWRRSFGADADVVGNESLILDGVSYLIVGVVADGLPYPESAGEVWVPSDPSHDELVEGMRGARYLDVIGRLRPGATLVEARTELDAFVLNLGEDHPNHVGWGATAVSLRQDMIRPFVGLLRVLLVGAALFLLIACSNVAGLVAARRAEDRSERGLRLALGASRWCLLRHEIAEMLWLSLGAAVVAAVLAGWALAPLQRLAPSDVPRIADIRLDPVVVAALTGFLLLAAVSAAVVGNFLAAGARQSVRGTGKTVSPNAAGRATLTVIQVALTTLLLIGGAALADHFRALARIEPGFVPGPVMTAPVAINANNYPENAARLQFFESVIEGLEQRGHTAVVGTNPPVAGANMRYGYRPGDGDEDQYWAQYHTVSPRYFEVLGIPLVSGRDFNDRDRADGIPVVIISETLARAHFDGDPLGREMSVVGTSREIVGVVGSVHHFGPDQGPPAEMYVPFAQDPWAFGHLLIRPGAGFSPYDAREIVAAIDPVVPVQAMFPFDRFVRTWFAPLRFQLTIVGLLAAAGTSLAVIGLYALIAYLVAGRTREIGIRVALGETARSVFARVVGRGLALAVAGLGVGIAAALALRGLLGSLGVGIDADDPAVLLAVAALVGVAAAGACVLPARRAAAVDPVIALRHE
jgi:predicted permease